ncbi:MAG: GHKL domain-containing protein [Desulfobacteraceae bacterium]|nr:MAG: GHKL domain-containing protein [Desulfobacteraceae bacterium]
MTDGTQYNTWSPGVLPVRIILPVLLTIALFIVTIFFLMIPILEKNMMDGKREGIMHLTESAWSTLDLFYNHSQNGQLSRKDAQQSAMAQLRQLRYGPDRADYFWINDMTPRMIMHPYRPDLEGQDISDFKDPAGKRLFVEMVQTVNRQGDGFVDYLWQWKDQSEKIVPKISYVKGFEPWGWIIGTGIYVEDVREEIRTITRRLLFTCSGILILFLLVSGYIIFQGARAQKERMAAMEQTRLREKQLIQADKMTSLGILVAGVAHEINNPATSLMLNAPNLKKAFQAFTPILDDHFEDRTEERVCNMPYQDLRQRIDMMLTAIEDSSSRIKRIISELKDFSRPAQADMGKPVNVNQVVEKSVELTRSVLKKATAHLSIQLDPSLPLILGDFQKLQQVVINLLVNAAQALETMEASITVKTGRPDEIGFVMIEVKDTGPGIDLSDLEKIKDPFYTTKRDDGGTGLGLSISEKIVNEHNGMIRFHSPPGQGVTAQILLPENQQGQSEDKGENR